MLSIDCDKLDRFNSDLTNKCKCEAQHWLIPLTHLATSQIDKECEGTRKYHQTKESKGKADKLFLQVVFRLYFTMQVARPTTRLVKILH